MKGALVKLEHINLLQFFKDTKIFYSSGENKSRNEILFKAKSSLLVGQKALVIGDSPKDVLSAKFNKLQVLAVATGMHSAEELASYEPEYLLESTWELGELLKILQDIS